MGRRFEKREWSGKSSKGRCCVLGLDRQRHRSTEVQHVVRDVDGNEGG